MTRDLPEHGASASHVVGGNHDLPARERGVGEVDVDVSLGKLAGQLAQGCGPVLHVDHEDLPLVGDPHSGALKRRPAPDDGLIVEEHVHQAPALTGEGRKAMDSNPRFAGNLCQPGQLARPVLENHCQVRRHRIFDLSTASGTRQSGHTGRLSAVPAACSLARSGPASVETFRKLADAGVNVDLLLPVRISDELFFAVICVDGVAAARGALGGQVVNV